MTCPRAAIKESANLWPTTLPNSCSEKELKLHFISLRAIVQSCKILFTTLQNNVLVQCFKFRSKPEQRKKVYYWYSVKTWKLSKDPTHSCPPYFNPFHMHWNPVKMGRKYFVLYLLAAICERGKDAVWLCTGTRLRSLSLSVPGQNHRHSLLLAKSHILGKS